MKKISCILAFVFITVFLYSQSPRLVLLEEFTSSTCGYCSGINPTIWSRMQQYPDKFTAIFYHVNWPAPGNDPMYLANPSDNNARVSLYGITGVPWSILDGNYWNGYAYNWTMTTINTRQAAPSPFEIQLNQQLSPAQDSIYMTMLAKATQSVSGIMVAHNVVIEKHIHFTSPPGTNGEKDFYNVLKKMLPGKNGTVLPSVVEPGDYVIIETAWKFANVYTVSEIAGIGFIQNTSTKEIHQAVNSSINPIVPPYDNDVHLLEVRNISATSCLGKVTPVIKIRNNGKNTLTSLDIKYRVNEESLNTYNWSGNLATLQKMVITLPEYTFTPQENNTLQVYSANPNSVPDEYPKNDSVNNISIRSAKSTTNTIYLVLRTDNNPQETTWDVKNSLGQVIKSGGPYAQGLTIYRDTIYLPQADCFTFTIYDAGGNGICCSNGTGSYQITDSQGTVIKQGGTFGDKDLSEFRMDPPVAIGNLEKNTALNVFPIPSAGNITVSFYIPNPGKVVLNVFNIYGQLINAIDLGSLQAGQHEYVMDAGNLKPGIYTLQLRSGLQIQTKKITVIK